MLIFLVPTAIIFLLLVFLYLASAPKRLLKVVGLSFPLSEPRRKSLDLRFSNNFIGSSNVQIVTFDSPLKTAFILQGLFSKTVYVAISEAWIRNLTEANFIEFFEVLDQKVCATKDLRRRTLRANINLLIFKSLPQCILDLLLPSEQKEYRISSLDILRFLLTLPAIFYFNPTLRKVKTGNPLHAIPIISPRFNALGPVFLASF